MISVYGIRNTVVNKWYVGSSIDTNRRFKEHNWGLKNNKHHSAKLQRAYNKYGKDAFEYHILAEYSTDTNLDQHEILWTILLDAIKNGYVLKAGTRNHIVSEESRKKMAQSHIGHKHSKETRKKMSDAGKRKIFSEEHRKKLSEAAKGKVFTEQHKANMRNKIVSMETRQKISDALKRQYALKRNNI